MAISSEEYEQALEAAERNLMARGGGTAVKRVSHTGATTTRETEFDKMSTTELKSHIRWLERKLGFGCSRKPLYP